MDRNPVTTPITNASNNTNSKFMNESPFRSLNQLATASYLTIVTESYVAAPCKMLVASGLQRRPAKILRHHSWRLPGKLVPCPSI